MFSVITVTWNNLEGVKDTLASVRAQTVEPLQHIVIDGGSSDGTAEWLSHQLDFLPLEFISEPDMGIYDAMNKGIAKAHADFTIFLNAGDRFATENTLDLIRESQNRAGWSWAYGDSLLVPYGLNSSSGNYHKLALARWPRFFAGMGTIPHQSAVFATESLRAQSGYRLDVGLSADQELMLRLWRHQRPYYLRHTIAICDANGVSSGQAAGAFARQMSSHRASNNLQIGNTLVDRAVTSLAVTFDWVKNAMSQTVRSRRYLKRAHLD